MACWLNASQKFEKRTRGRQARDASAAGLNTDGAPPSVGKDEFIQVGAIVEYVLSAAVKADLQVSSALSL
jgi:hypothetical protein